VYICGDKVTSVNITLVFFTLRNKTTSLSHKFQFLNSKTITARHIKKVSDLVSIKIMLNKVSLITQDNTFYIYFNGFNVSGMPK